MGLAYRSIFIQEWTKRLSVKVLSRFFTRLPLLGLLLYIFSRWTLLPSRVGYWQQAKIELPKSGCKSQRKESKYGCFLMHVHPAFTLKLFKVSLCWNLVKLNVIFQDGDASGAGYSVGNDIGNLEVVRWALRTQFDRDVVTHYECQVDRFNPLTPMSDQDRISPYKINTISTR